MPGKEKVTKAILVPCEVYSRVVGYFRPTSNWNAGKQQEFKERKTVSLSSISAFANRC